MSNLNRLVEEFEAPTIIVDRKADILASNSAYQAALDAFGFEDLPTLYAYGGSGTRLFIQQAIAATGTSGEMHHAMIPVRHAQVRAAITFTPLTDLTGPEVLYTDLCLGVFHLVQLSPAVALAMIERDYGLTEREMYFTAHLIAGHTLPEAANHMDMSFEQARSELRTILAKTDTSSLEDLSDLVGTLLPA